MRKLKSCYKTEITLPADVASVSFCFRDSNGNWDNNSGNDYWYTPAIGETYSNVEITLSEKEDKIISSTAKATTIKKAVKSEKQINASIQLAFLWGKKKFMALEIARKFLIRMPDLKIVLTGTKYGYKRPDGVYVIPIGCLKDQ